MDEPFLPHELRRISKRKGGKCWRHAGPPLEVGFRIHEFAGCTFVTFRHHNQNKLVSFGGCRGLDGGIKGGAKLGVMICLL